MRRFIVSVAFDFSQAFRALTGHIPFPWQRRLFEELGGGVVPPAVDIPTGLGKTAVMAVWLLARAAGARLPRRLVYVVDRRAVVDQATDFALELRKRLAADALAQIRAQLGLGDRPLPISTLRGKHVDNREWMADPTSPAIIVGTVDMIGSRLLFEGYGVSRRMRPYQAGLLGCDTLVLLDEAHLSLPFQRLLRSIEVGKEHFANQPSETPPSQQFGGDCGSAAIIPPLKLLPLSATLGGRIACRNPFTINRKDRENQVVHQRLHARKVLVVENLNNDEKLQVALAGRTWSLAREEAEKAGRPVRTVTYCNSRRVAENVKRLLVRQAKREKTEAAVILFVGGRRIYERESAAKELEQYGLLADCEGPPANPVFLVATSAGEVGVDLSADHMVCDLVAWERMVQRLGRVNRRGSGSARIVVIDQGPPTEKAAGRGGIERHLAVKVLLNSLPQCEQGYLAGPAMLLDAGQSEDRQERIETGSTAMPLYPPLTRSLLDAWAMTSVAEHAGRPEVQPWLRGWIDDEPQTTVVWRKYLPIQVRSTAAGPRAAPLPEATVKTFFDAASPHTTERLETETKWVVDWLKKRLRTMMRKLKGARGSRVDGNDTGQIGDYLIPPFHRDMPIAFLLDSGNAFERVLTPLEVVDSMSARVLHRILAGRVVVVDARVSGLNDGLLDAACGDLVPTAENNWGVAESANEQPWTGEAVQSSIRVGVVCHDEREGGVDQKHSSRRAAEQQQQGAWMETWASPYPVVGNDTPKHWLIVEKWRNEASEEDTRGITAVAQRLDAHQRQAALEAERIANKLGLPSAYRDMLVGAARHHDDGKRAVRWQRAFNAPSKGGPYAKTEGPFNRYVLGGFRHELQSVLDVMENGIDGLSPGEPEFDLALHLIATHHGYSRPTIGIEGCDSLPPTAVANWAYEIATRFARLQREWGPWGLAWWEALLRSADQRASRDVGAPKGKLRTGASHESPASIASAADAWR